MSKLRDRLTNPKDIERYDRNYNSMEVYITQGELDRELVKAYNDGQAYILDKIRAEIENLYEYTSREDYIHQEETRAFIDKSEVLEIIDKYKDGE